MLCAVRVVVRSAALVLSLSLRAQHVPSLEGNAPSFPSKLGKNSRNTDSKDTYVRQ